MPTATRRSLAAALLAAATTACGYNTMQRKDETVNQAAAQIRVQLQRRADLIPNLVETVRGFARQESLVLLGVTEARSRLAGALQGQSGMGELAAANQAVSSALGRLLAVVEAYPDLKSNQNFLALQDQLEGTENRIAVARQDYNRAVEDYNSFVRQFPYNLTARIFGMHRPREYFELATPEADQVPQVRF
jgi:LemA protein